MQTSARPLGPLVDRLIASGAFSGAAVLIARGGTLRTELYAGEAAPGIPASASTIWPIASISKCFTSAMVMRLVELGELNVNTLVHAVIPEFADEGRDAVRLRHLLTHTSGLPYESEQMEARLKAQTPLDGLFREALTAPLLFRPGSRFRYSDYAFLFAARMAELATGVGYPELIRTLVLEPMGLHDTSVVQPPEVHDRMAYVRGVLAEGTDGALYNSRYSRGLGHAALSVASSGPDMLRFAQHFAPGGPRIHAEATVRAMTTCQTGEVPGEHPLVSGYGPDARIPWSYAFSLQTAQAPAILSELASFSAFGHPGASGCHFVVDPVSDTIVVVLTNGHLVPDVEGWSRRQARLLAAAFVEAEAG